MTRDFADFLDALNKEGATWVIIGGLAVLYHLPYRTTRDIDVVIEPTLENARRVRRAVGAWGGFEPKFSEAEFISGDILSFGGLLRVEIHSNVPGVTWEQVWGNRIEDEFMGVPAAFASIDDLISMKQAAGRPDTDVPDLERLRLLRDRREQ